MWASRCCSEIFQERQERSVPKRDVFVYSSSRSINPGVGQNHCHTTWNVPRNIPFESTWCVLWPSDHPTEFWPMPVLYPKSYQVISWRPSPRPPQAAFRVAPHPTAAAPPIMPCAGRHWRQKWHATMREAGWNGGTMAGVVFFREIGGIKHYKPFYFHDNFY